MKRKNKMKNGFSLLTALLLAAGLSVTAAAADSSVVFEDGKVTVFESGSAYTDSDLFENFKGVMPGDVRTEEITVENRAGDCDYIKVYLRAVPHDEDGNPVSGEVLEELRADRRRGNDSELEYMYDFLSQLSMKVTSGDSVLYEESPDRVDGLADNVYLGTLREKETVALNVELSVPIEMGSEYSGRIGEVDWVFVAEGFDDPDAPPERHPGPDDGDDEEDVPAAVMPAAQTPAAPIQIPEQPQTDGGTSPQTGDSANPVLWILAAAFGALVLIAVIARRRKRERGNG